MVTADKVGQWLLANYSGTNANFWLFLCGIRFRVSLRVRVKVRVRLEVLLTRLTLGGLHACVREWLASSHLDKVARCVSGHGLRLRTEQVAAECVTVGKWLQFLPDAIDVNHVVQMCVAGTAVRTRKCSSRL